MRKEDKLFQFVNNGKNNLKMNNFWLAHLVIVNKMKQNEKIKENMHQQQIY